MKRTDADYHVGNLFQSGNPLTSQRGTRVDHTWLNAVQEELAHTIEAAGIDLNGADNSQLFKAIQSLGGGFDTLDLANVAATSNNSWLQAGSIAVVRNYATSGDGGGFVGVVETADNPSYPGGGRIRPVDRIANVRWWGAVGDGVTDDTAAVLAALTYSSSLYFPCVPAGQFYLIDSADLVLASTASPREDVTLIGDSTGANGELTSSIRFGSAYGLKVNGAVGNYCLRNLTTRNLFIGPKNSVSRSTPIFDGTGVLYWNRENCHFQGDTLKEQPTVRLRWSIGLESRNTRVWGGSIGQDLGAPADPMNGVTLIGDNYNGSRRSLVGAVTAFNMQSGLVQACGDGIMISSGGKVESSSAVRINGVYFENNKFHDGSNWTGRDIVLGDDAWVRAPDIRGNYHAQLAADNPFTSGEGKSALPPVYIEKIIGGAISGNFWTNSGLSEYVEIGHHNQAGVRFPRHVEIVGNTDLFIHNTASAVWSPTVTEEQKFALFANDQLVVQGPRARRLGHVKTLRSPLVSVTATGLVRVPLMDSAHYGYINQIKMLTGDGFDISGTLSVGVSASPTFYVDDVAVGATSGPSVLTIAINNRRIAPANGLIFADLDIMTFAEGGSFVLEVEYTNILE